MQPPDEQQSPSSPPDSHSEIPDDTSRTEQGSVSTKFQPGTDRILKRGALLAAGILALGFVVVTLIRLVDAHSLRKAADLAYTAAPPVDVITVRSAQIGQDLILPGQTAAWFETTIYARVNGYVAKWLVDIGDHVKKGQVLAIIETPELDAELNAAKAQLKSSEAQVAAREAEAQFSKSTNERWRDSPKGVVSDQEREAKKADYESANARLYAANAQVALENLKSINTGTWRSSSRSSRPLTAPSPNAKSTSAISSLRAAHRTPHRCIAWRKPTPCGSSWTCPKARQAN